MVGKLFCADEFEGAIIALVNKATQRAWASPKHPLALFTYQTLGPEAYDAFIAAYLTVKTWWGPQDFGKPGIAHLGATSREWHPTLRQCWVSEDAQKHRLLAELAIDDPASAAAGLVAWPASLYLDIVMPKAAPQLQIRFTSLGKQQNRLPEAVSSHQLVRAATANSDWEAHGHYAIGSTSPRMA